MSSFDFTFPSDLDYALLCWLFPDLHADFILHNLQPDLLQSIDSLSMNYFFLLCLFSVNFLPESRVKICKFFMM